MKLSMRKAMTRFVESVAATVRDKHIVVTKRGSSATERIAVQRVRCMDFEEATIIRCELGLGGLQVHIPSNFDDPAFSRDVLGLQD